MVNQAHKTFLVYYRSVLFLFCCYWLHILFLSLARISFLLRFGDWKQLSLHRLDLLEAFWVGFLFDSQAIAMFIAPFYILHSLLWILSQMMILCGGPLDSLSRWSLYVQAAITRLHNFHLGAWRLSPYLLGLLSFLLHIFLLVDQYYYSYFQSHIDIRIFAFLEDDTGAIITSIGKEFPVFFVCLLLLLAGAFTLLALKKIFLKINRAQKLFLSQLWHRACFFLASSLLCLLLLRASIGAHPLKRRDRAVSPYQFLNFLAYNGIISFWHAWQDKREFQYSTDMQKILKLYEHDSIEEAIRNYYGIKDLDQALARYLYRKNLSSKTRAVLSKNYHVVLIIMESWSAYYFQLHKANFNLLGALEEEMDHLIYFPYFLSAQNGTITSLESLLIFNPEQVISQTEYGLHPFPSAITRPFQEASYTCHFISSGKLHWRDLNRFLPHQGFTKLTGQAALEALYPNAQRHAWGVFDGYMFSYIIDLLQKAKKPQFITALSTSHHPPYEVPQDYKAFPLAMPEEVERELTGSKSQALRAFGAFQYANHSLGLFLKQLQAAELGKNTIVAITGDHNTWAFFDFHKEKFHWKYAVPFMLYLPPELRKKVHVDTRRFGSHADISASIFPLVLPEAVFLQVGKNLLSDSDLDFFAANAGGWALNHVGAVSTLGARYYYQWSDAKRTKLIAVEARPELERLRKKAQAQRVIMNYAVRMEAAQKKEQKQKK